MQCLITAGRTYLNISKERSVCKKKEIIYSARFLEWLIIGHVCIYHLLNLRIDFGINSLYIF